jgi:Protein of unknown function (DUF3106)
MSAWSVIFFKKRLLLAGFMGLGAMSASVFAQTPPTTPGLPLMKAAVPQAAASAGKAASNAGVPVPVKPISSKPAWSELTPLQQTTLQPLAASWAALSEPQKRKWLKISKGYPSLPPEGQTTMHSRMNEWVALSPQERSVARLNFAKTKELARQLTPDEKKAKWASYQALSAEEKQKLAAKGTVPAGGAAPAIKPVAKQKLAAVPPSVGASGVRDVGKLPAPSVTSGAAAPLPGTVSAPVASPLPPAISTN